MNIKKSLLAILALSSVTGAAYADITVMSNDKGSVEVYGIADAAVGSLQHSLNVDPQFPGSVVLTTAYKQGTAASSSATGLFNGGISPSRFGFKGGMDIGNGMKAFFTLESGFNVTTGRLSNAAGCLADNTGATATTDCANSSLNGQIFERQAFVGLSDEKAGSLALGRNYAPIYDVSLAYDPVQNAQLFSPMGFSGTFGGGGGVSEDTRVDGSLKYKNNFGPVNVSLLYKMGGVSGASSAKSATGIGIGYEEGPFGVQFAYESFTDGMKGVSLGTATGATITPNTVGVAVYDTKAFILAGKFKINDAATAKIGYETYTLGAPSNSGSLASMVGSSFYGQNVGTGYTTTATCATSNSAYAGGVLADACMADQKTNIWFIGGDYNFSDKLNLAAGYYNISLQQSADYTPKSASNPAAATGQASGTQSYVSLLADYRYSKSLDAYAGVMFISFSGNAYPSAIYYTSNQLTAAGVRFKF